MFIATEILIALFSYILLLFFVAFIVEKNLKFKHKIINSPIVYTLSLAVYCTAWTLFGSVGKAVNDGFLYLAIYTGPTISIVFWWMILRKITKIKDRYRITSIADFIGTRYNSFGLVVFTTIIAVVVSTPYIALQIKAIENIFILMVDKTHSGSQNILAQIDIIIVSILILFTIVFGVRRLDPTEHHPGMMAVVAFGSIIKLVSFLLIGIFVTFFVFNGFDHVFQLTTVADFPVEIPNVNSSESTPISLWLTYTILSFSAILFLPRQFHVAVIENANEKQIKTAQWLLPFYLILINVFVLPIAISGLSKGIPFNQADGYVMAIPLMEGKPFLAIMVLFGGFSAATSMIMVSSMTLSTMVANHLVLPIGKKISISKFLNKHLLQLRWVVVTVVILLGYFFDVLFGDSNSLVSMGIIAFAGVLQYAPSILGGLFWKNGNRNGAIWGLSAGFIVWAYTLIVPLLVKEGFISTSLLIDGPFGLGILRPESLLYLDIVDPLSQSVFWSLTINISLYIVLSILKPSDNDSQIIANEQVGILALLKPIKEDSDEVASIDLGDKKRIFIEIFSQYFPEEEVNLKLTKNLTSLGLESRDQITISEMILFYNEMQRDLSGIISASEAHKVLKRESVFSNDEVEILQKKLQDVMVELKVSPEELLKRMDYYKEKEKLISSYANELEKQVERQTQNLKKANKKLKNEVNDRVKAETEVKKERDRVQNYLDIAGVLIVALDPNGCVTLINKKGCEILQGEEKEILGLNWFDSFIHEDVKEETKSVFRNILQNNVGKFEYNENKIISLKGEVKILAWNNSLLKDEDDQIIGSLSSGTDITVLKLSKQALKKSEKKFRAIIENSNDAIYLLQNNQFVLVNKRFTELFGLNKKDVLAKNFDFMSLVAPESKKLIADRLKNREKGIIPSPQYEFFAINGDGQKLLLEVSTTEIELETGIAVQGVLRDITEKQQLEVQLRSAQRLESIGQLAAGVAHEINTPVQFIGDNLNFIKPGIVDLIKLTSEMEKVINQGTISEEDKQTINEKIKDIDVEYLAEEIPNAINETIDGVDRVSEIVRAMKEFTHPGKKEMSPTNINKLLSDTIVVAKNEWKYVANLTTEFDENLPPVMCLAGELNQVFLNLIINSSHSISERLTEMEGKDRGEIKISTLLENNNVKIIFRDNGKGIPEEIKDRVFDPFFTTKDVGKGTGQGLAIAYNLIVEKHFGKISFESEVGKGTEFNITLPLHQDEK